MHSDSRGARHRQQGVGNQWPGGGRPRWTVARRHGQAGRAEHDAASPVIRVGAAMSAVRTREAGRLSRCVPGRPWPGRGEGQEGEGPDAAPARPVTRHNPCTAHRSWPRVGWMCPGCGGPWPRSRCRRRPTGPGRRHHLLAAAGCAYLARADPVHIPAPGYALETGRRSWTAPLAALRLAPGDDGATVTAR